MKPYPENMNPDLLVLFLSKETSPEQEELVREWIMQSDENRKQFEEFKEIWEKSENALDQPSDIDTDVAWNKFSARIDSEDAKKTDNQVYIKSKKRPIGVWVRVAAVLIPLLAIAYLVIFQNFNPKTIVATTENDKKEIALSDGTQVILNSHSELRYPEKFGSGKRQVELIGEAFFTVTPDKDHPFVISTEKATVTVLGTSFNVKSADNKRVEVYVKTGLVLFSSISNQDSVFLEPGMKGILDCSTGKISVDSTDTGNDLFWMNKVLKYQKRPLSDVFNELSEQYNVSIIAADSSIGNLRLTSSFSNNSIDQILEVIGQSFNLTVSKSGTKYTIDLGREE
ncbi:MAG: hypothetical protein CVU11_08570 [Bacteroidetes bacterium HGW-Bacteroidetes-6]|jgi:ferric-dicitrate binding protein FerR (iron transport regulator)|nr:MAG: hypothetical protein CVU11_08570 [Bacteroidetes bacterium HGW-Bacteroidetes-6]